MSHDYENKRLDWRTSVRANVLGMRERDVKIHWQREWFAEEEKREQMTFAMCRNAGFCNHTQLQKDLRKRTHSMMLMIHTT